MPTELPFYTRYADGFRVGAWTVLPRSNELSRPGETVHVEPKPMQVLTLLAERAGETLTREELVEAVWPEVYVTENALSRCISQLRKLFDDDARTPRVIETIPTVGYRLIAPVYHLGDGTTVPSAASEVALRVAARSEAEDAGPSVQPATSAPSRGARSGWVAATALAAALGLAVWTGIGQAEVKGASATRPLTSDLGRETAPALSPDGSRVAYMHDARDARNIYVRVIGSGTPLQLTDGPANDFAPAWAPDGRSIAFIRCEEWECRLFSVPALGGEPRRLDDDIVGAGPTGLSYTPDGERLVFTMRTAPGEPLQIAALDLATHERHTLTTPPERHLDMDPVVSPDGAAFLFRRQTSGGGQDLYIASFEGGEPRRLTHDSRSLAGYAWTPDGRDVIFSSNRTGMYELWRLPASGGTPERVPGIVARDPGRSAVGTDQLVFEEWAFEVNLWAVHRDSTEARSIVTSTWWDKHPHLSSDGQRLAFISNRTGPPEVWVADAGGSDPSQRTDFGGASVEAPRWSPDGKRLVFQARPDIQANLYVMDAEGGAPRVLTPDTSAEVLPRWSRNGQRIYFGSNRSGTWQLWSMPTQGGDAVQVTESGGIVGEESADGSEIFYAKPAEVGLWARPAGGGPERLVTDALIPAAFASWAVTDDGVLFIGHAEESPRVLRVDPATGEVEALPAGRGVTTQGEPSLTASADGQRIVFAQVDRVESDLMVAAPFE